MYLEEFTRSLQFHHIQGIDEKKSLLLATLSRQPMVAIVLCTLAVFLVTL